MRAHPFSLNKWYLDCVTAGGELAILYCAELCWRGAHLSLNSVLAGTNGQIHTNTSVSRYRIDVGNQDIAIDLPKLGVSGTWQAECPPCERLVYECKDGSLRWNCLQPRSTVHLQFRDRVLNGFGYAERVCLTIPPWNLPLRQLRWGRFVSSDDALTWVDWQGGCRTAFAVRDGRETSLLSASETEVVTPSATLHIEPGFVLRSGTLASTILPDLPVLRKVLPRALFNVEERKSCSRGQLSAPDRASAGWVIHEVVDWNVQGASC